MIRQEDVDFLAHFGTKGMRWGVRKAERDGVSRSTDRTARKDAEEFARAKMFFGEGAGTRRKLINKTVEARSKNDPNYAKAFQKHLAAQDLSVHASKARSERASTDRKDRTKKRAGYLARRFTGEMGTQAAFTAIAVGGVAFLASPKGQSMMSNLASKTKNYLDNARNRQTEEFLQQYIRQHGPGPSSK